MSGIKPSRMTNAGLLTASLVTVGGDEVMDLNMVVQVRINQCNISTAHDHGEQVVQEGDEFIRTIYDPLA